MINTTEKTYQIQIALRGSKPKIWRRILVPSDLLLPDFHIIIQITMGWTNSHYLVFAETHSQPEKNKRAISFLCTKIGVILNISKNNFRRCKIEEIKMNDAE